MSQKPITELSVKLKGIAKKPWKKCPHVCTTFLNHVGNGWTIWTTLDTTYFRPSPFTTAFDMQLMHSMFPLKMREKGENIFRFNLRVVCKPMWVRVWGRCDIMLGYVQRFFMLALMFYGPLSYGYKRWDRRVLEYRPRIGKRNAGHPQAVGTKIFAGWPATAGWE